MAAESDRTTALSIYDLAHHLGISSGTVSRALNNRPEVSAATRKRVLEAATQLGFSPSPLARGLARNQSQAIGVIVPSIDDPFFLSFARGVQNAAIASGLAVVLSFADTSDSVTEAVRSFVAFRAAGILVLGGSDDVDANIASIAGTTPTVVTLRRAKHTEFSSVFIDHEAGARAMVKHLIESGRKKVAFVSLPLNSQAAIGRLNGYRAVERQAVPEWTVFAHGSGFLDGVDATNELLSARRSEEIDAIFYASDVLATGGLHALASHGISVPDQIAVAGFGDIDSSAVTVPSLSTMRIPMYEVGETAAKLLFDAIENREGDIVDVELSLELVERHSTRDS